MAYTQNLYIYIVIVFVTIEINKTMAEPSQEELKLLAAVFKDLKVKPKMDTSNDFKKWMVSYVSQMGDKSGVQIKQGKFNG